MFLRLSIEIQPETIKIKISVMKNTELLIAEFWVCNVTKITSFSTQYTKSQIDTFKPLNIVDVLWPLILNTSYFYPHGINTLYRHAVSKRVHKEYLKNNDCLIDVGWQRDLLFAAVEKSGYKRIKWRFGKKNESLVHCYDEIDWLMFNVTSSIFQPYHGKTINIKT